MRTKIDLYQNQVGELKEKLKQHNTEWFDTTEECSHQLTLLGGDLKIMQSVLLKTACGEKVKDKAMLLQCQDGCTGRTYSDVSHPSFGRAALQLRSAQAQGAFESSLASVATKGTEEPKETNDK